MVQWHLMHIKKCMHVYFCMCMQVYESPMNWAPWHVCLQKAGLCSGLSATVVSNWEALYPKFIDFCIWNFLQMYRIGHLVQVSFVVFYRNWTVPGSIPHGPQPEARGEQTGWQQRWWSSQGLGSEAAVEREGTHAWARVPNQRLWKQNATLPSQYASEGAKSHFSSLEQVLIRIN